MFLKVFFNNLNKFRQTVFINVKQNFSVANLKSELFKSVKIPVQRQVIMFLGTILTDDFPVAKAFNRNRADLQAFDGQELVCLLHFRDKMEFKETLSTSSSMMSQKNEKPQDAQSEFVGLEDGCSSASSSASSQPRPRVRPVFNPP